MKPRQYPTGRMFRVQCTHNHFHTISINAKGQIVLHNHCGVDRHRNRAFRELGGQPIGCFRFLERWRYALKTGKGSSQLPSTMVPCLRDCQQLKIERARTCAELHERVANDDRPFLQRPRIIAELMNRVLVKQMRLPAEQWVDVNGAYSLMVTPFPGAQSVLYGTVPPTWTEAIYGRGLAFARGGLLINLSDLQQGKGTGTFLCPIRLCPGVVALRLKQRYL